MKRVAKWTGRLLQVTGALALGYVAFMYARAQGFQVYEQWVFDRYLAKHAPLVESPQPQISEAPAVPNGTPETSTEPSQAAPEPSNEIADGSSGAAAPSSPAPNAQVDMVMGRMEIPRLHLSTMVVEGDNDQELLLGAGHVPGTAQPGQRGNLVIAAHRDTFFRPLHSIAKDDKIVLTTYRGTFRYSVDDIEIIDPSNTTVLAPTPQPSLTLVTCYPFYYVGAAPKRFIVRARLVG